jgi:drug/metabolite transporter (DMT)-like permease
MRSTASPLAAQRAPSELRTSVLLGVLCAIWGSTWIVIKGGLRDLPPLTSAAARFALAALVMAALAPALARAEGGRAPPRWLSMVLGTLNFALSYAIVYTTETVLPSGLTSVLWATFPMMQAALGHLFLPFERIAPRQWLGFALGFAGVVALFASDLRAEGLTAAALLLLASPAVSALGNTLIKRHGSEVSSALLNRNGLAIGAVFLSAAALLAEGGAPAHWTVAALASVAYLSIFGTVVAFGLYFWLLRHAPAYRVSLISYITPAIALLLGALAGDEPVTASTLGGSALILCGVALVMRGQGRA